MIPEFHRPVSADRIAPKHRVEAAADERARLAERLGIPAIASLVCVFRLRAIPGAVIEAEGQLDAAVTQTCVVTLDPVDQRVADAFHIRFVPAGRESDDPDPESPDEIAYENGVIDLGEAAAQQLALALDPYPRSPGAELPAMDDHNPNPFAVLASRR